MLIQKIGSLEEKVNPRAKRLLPALAQNFLMAYPTSGCCRQDQSAINGSLFRLSWQQEWWCLSRYRFWQKQVCK